MIAQASSGTGKTGTFAIATLQCLDPKDRQTQALVLAPTRELATQINKVMSKLGEFMHVHTHCCVGGTSVREDLQALEKGVHVVAGTPGRVSDMIKRNSIVPGGVKMLILDEADEMLSKGFKDQVFFF